MSTIADNYKRVQARIEEACRRAGRDTEAVTVVAVAKTFPADVIVSAAEAGIAEIGESRAQEFKEKVGLIGDRVTWHFVGHLQTNKVRIVTGAAALIHSVDRFGLAEAIARRALEAGSTQDVLIEANIARDPAKHGSDPARVLALAEQVAALDGVEVKGLMAMAPFTDDPAETRPYFEELRRLSDALQQELPGANALSMGMTRDFEVAVEEGATIVRIGEAIFGPRH